MQEQQQAFEIEAAIFLVDIVGSTRLYETLGNDAARRTIARSLGAVAQAVRQHRGVVVKTIGDALLAYFRSADQAVACGFRAAEQSAAGGPRLSICCHHGTVLLLDGDIYGDAVNVTAHIGKKARPGELLTTGETVARLSDRGGLAVERLDEVWLKSRSAPTTLYLVSRRGGEETTSLEASNGGLFQKVALMHGRQVYEVGRRARTGLVIGRAPDCDLVFDDARVSRRHATVESKGRHVYVRDHSRNGTFLWLGDGVQVPLLREEHRLAGSGVIALGTAATARTASTLTFRCRS
jgi:adenylate cyclase